MLILLDNEEMYEIVGGAAKSGVWTIIGGVVSFVVGLFNGFFQTKACKIR